MNRLSLTLSALLLFAGAGAAESPRKGFAGAGAAEPPRKGAERVVFHTAAGDIVFAFYPDVAPKHVKHFLKLVEEGVYDSTHFGRLEKGFVLQLFTAEDRRTQLSERQIALLKPVKAEFSKLLHRRGILSMARRDDDVNSGCSSFSILLGAAPHLDGKYTIFGEVEKGMDVVDELCKVPLDGNRPRVPLEVRKAIIVSSAAQLSELNLVAAHPVEEFAAAATTGYGDGLPIEFAGGLILIVACSVFCFALWKLLPSRVILSLVLVNVLIGSFLLLMLLTPIAQAHSILAIAVFAGLLSMFKMMSQFESPA